MKLLTRTSRYYLLFSFILFVIGGIGLFFMLKAVIQEEDNETLQENRPALKSYLEKRDNTSEVIYLFGNVVFLEPIEKSTSLEIFSDTLLLKMEEGEEELEPYHKYTYTEVLNGKLFKVSLCQPGFENEDLISSILMIVLVILLILFLILNRLNIYLSRKIWQPFYRTIDQIQQFSFQKGTPPNFGSSEIEEFEVLNNNLEQMTGKLIHDFQMLQRFTENASHELQTPLAIIRNQVDLLFQVENQKQEVYDSLRGISEAISRLTRLHQCLVLLTRIEHEQFQTNEPLHLDQLILDKLTYLKPATDDQNITIDYQIAPCLLYLPKTLADVLLNNLLSNALKHNFPGGKIRMILSDQKLSVSNTSNERVEEPEEMFQRFKKGDNNKQSLGLGLSIIKEISDLNGFSIGYEIEEEWHTLTIGFSTAE